MRTFHCGSCNATIETFDGYSDVTCPDCGQEHNAYGQRLRANWRNNPSNYDEDISDLEGYEMSFHDD